MTTLFGEHEEAETLFCGRWSLEEATAKMLDVKFQGAKQFPKLLSELYAHSFRLSGKSSALFEFLEARFNRNLIQDKEVHLHFEVVHSREEAREL